MPYRVQYYGTTLNIPYITPPEKDIRADFLENKSGTHNEIGSHAKISSILGRTSGCLRRDPGSELRTGWGWRYIFLATTINLTTPPASPPLFIGSSRPPPTAHLLALWSLCHARTPVTLIKMCRSRGTAIRLSRLSSAFTARKGMAHRASSYDR